MEGTPSLTIEGNPLLTIEGSLPGRSESWGWAASALASDRSAATRGPRPASFGRRLGTGGRHAAADPAQLHICTRAHAGTQARRHARKYAYVYKHAWRQLDRELARQQGRQQGRYLQDAERRLCRHVPFGNPRRAWAPPCAGCS